MRRGFCTVVAGLMVFGAGTAVGTAGGTAFADGAGPTATPPASPQTQTLSGVAVNGVQLSISAPAQLPLDLPGQQLPEREVDVTVKDVGGQGYSGTVNTNLMSEGSGVSSVSLRLDHFDLASGLWETEDIPAGESSFGVADTVTVPANGTQVLKLRLSPGTTAVDDVKVSVSANGASAVATVPVTGPAFQVSGLTAAARAGAPTVFSGKLTNPTDVDFDHVPVKLALCSAGSAGCVAHASDVKVEVQTQSGGGWHAVSVADGDSSTAMTATVMPDVALPAGGSVRFSVRVTVGAGAFGASGQPSGPGQPTGPSGPSGQPSSPSSPALTQPLAVPVALSPVGLTLAGQPAVSGTLTVQPPPQPTPTTPSSTPSTSATSAPPTPTPTLSATDTDTATPTAPPTSAPTSAPATSAVAASTPGASASGNQTVLVAAGLLAVCLALLLWWGLMKRRERVARAVAGAEAETDIDDSDVESSDIEH